MNVLDTVTKFVNGDDTILHVFPTTMFVSKYPDSYDEEFEYIEWWIKNRILWIDHNIRKLKSHIDNDCDDNTDEGCIWCCDDDDGDGYRASEAAAYGMECNVGNAL